MDELGTSSDDPCNERIAFLEAEVERLNERVDRLFVTLAALGAVLEPITGQRTAEVGGSVSGLSVLRTTRTGT